MDIITIMFIAIGLSMDAFAVAVIEGMRKSRFTFALSVAACLGIFQAGLTFVGYFAGHLFAGYVANFSHWIAFGLLTIIGGGMVYSALFGKESESKAAAGF